MSEIIKIDLDQFFDNALKFINNKHERILNQIKDLADSGFSDSNEFLAILDRLEQVVSQYRSLLIVYSLLVEISFEKDV